MNRKVFTVVNTSSEVFYLFQFLRIYIKIGIIQQNTIKNVATVKANVDICMFLFVSVSVVVDVFSNSDRILPKPFKTRFGSPLILAVVALVLATVALVLAVVALVLAVVALVMSVPVVADIFVISGII